MTPAKKANALSPSARRLMRHAVDFGVQAIDLLFPPRCLYCDAELPRRTEVPSFSATPVASVSGRKNGSAAIAAVLCGH